MLLTRKREPKANLRAGEGAAPCLQDSAAPRVIYAWDNPGVPVDEVLNDIAAAFRPGSGPRWTAIRCLERHNPGCDEYHLLRADLLGAPRAPHAGELAN